MRKQMVSNIIRITIEEVMEDGERYYLARSPDVKGFLAQTATLEEMFTIAPEVMEMLLKAKNKRLEQEQAKKEMLRHMPKLLLSYDRIATLQLA
jgi:predicted RNase H-like HicB family nuclease